MSENVRAIEDNAFEKDILKAAKPSLVDFWAPWCGPCRAMEPVIDEIAGQFSEKINIFKCNVDDNPISPSTYGVKAIPTLIFFKDGQIFEQITGMASRTKLEEIINKIAG
ncbi:thioredoxin [Desulforegula conservatrix]|uniref:thioredoxin n=1 Tax=Desulforegula conservatrix TaxID=153026 RepID=UPI0003F8EF3A|nr:thioredoxin [Desulforegula conservatrix]